jgi:hypothetical protein
MEITIFKNIFSKEPHHITVEMALNRILRGQSEAQIAEIRKTLDKQKSSKLKANLPSVCFSGKFGKDRKDEQLEKHSGFIVLDFDLFYSQCSESCGVLHSFKFQVLTRNPLFHHLDGGQNS